MDWDQQQQQQQQQQHYRSQSVSIPTSQYPSSPQYADYGQQHYERRNAPANYPPPLPPLQVNPSTYRQSDAPHNLPSSSLPPVAASHLRGDRYRAQSVAIPSMGQREQRPHASSSGYARAPSGYAPEATVPISRSRQQQWPVQYPAEAMEAPQVPYISSVMSPYPHPSRVMPPLSELDRRTLPPVEESQPRPKPHVCDQCGGAFSRAHDLKRHVETHKGDRPHKCPTCTKAFSRKDALQRHQSMAQCGIEEY
ncbi:hypothetical protein FRC10_008625 [Ceratobasidium sp. 414]|nr:hypothetical protein FRC10_008625 [Ceratobasidium sp. 414]